MREIIFKVSLPAAFWWHYIPLYYSIPFFWWLFIAFWWLRNWTWCWWWWTSTRFADFFALSMNPLLLLQLQYSTFSARFSPLSKIHWLASGLGLSFVAFCKICKKMCSWSSLLVKWKITWVGATKCAWVFRCTITWFFVCKIKFSDVLSPGSCLLN